MTDLPKVVGGPARGSASVAADENDAMAQIEAENAAMRELGVPDAPEPEGGAPRGFRETGRESIVQEIPGLEFDVADGHAVGEGREIGGHATAIEREVVRDLPSNGEIVGPDRRSAMERVRDHVRQRAGSTSGADLARNALGPLGALVPDSFAGLESPTLDSVGDAWRTGSPDVAFPTAPRPEGVPASAPDRRMLAPAMGAVQGLTLDNADEAFGRLGDLVRGGSGRRDEMRDEQAQAIEQAPGAYSLGAVGGSLPYMAIPGGQETALGRIAAAGGVGLGMGALRGAGEAEGLRDVPREAVEGGLTEGAINAATAGVGEVAAPALRGGGNMLDEALAWARPARAESRLQAAGLMNPNPSPSTRYGRHLSRLGGPEGVAAMLDAEGIGGRMLPTAATEDDLARLARGAGSQFDDVGRRMDEAGGGVRRLDIVDRGEAALREGLDRLDTGPAQRASARVRSDYIEPLLNRGAPGPMGAGDDLMGWQQAHNYRQQLDAEARAMTRGSDPTEHSAAGGAQMMRDETSDLMSQALDQVDPALRGEWQQANRRWSLNTLLGDNARATGSRLPGAIAESIMGAGGNMTGAAAARAGGNLLSRYGPGLRVRSFDALIPALERGGPALARAARVLRGAQLRGGPAVAAAHWALSRQSPEYRLAVERAEGEQPEESDQ